MKLCIRKSDNSIINSIQTGHPSDKDLINNAISIDGGTIDDYYTIPITNREMFRAIMPNEAFVIYEFIKSDYLKKYLQLIYEKDFEEVDPLTLEEIQFKDGTDHLYKIYANKVLKRIQKVIKTVNGLVFRAEERRIENGKLYIKLCEKDKLRLDIESIQPEMFVTRNFKLLLNG